MSGKYRITFLIAIHWKVLRKIIRKVVDNAVSTYQASLKKQNHPENNYHIFSKKPTFNKIFILT